MVRRIFSFSIFLLLIVAACGQSPVILDPEPLIIDHAETAILLPKKLPIPLCPDDMVYISKGHYCIDTYEAPDQKGAYPLYAQSAYQAETYCSEHQKQLCTHQQWYGACVGPERKQYPYG